MSAKIAHLFQTISNNGIIGSAYLYLPQTASTNTYCRNLLSEEPQPPNGLVVRTGYQYEGRGQRGNVWQVQAGLNLTFSCVVYPHFLAPPDQFYLNMAVSLSVIDLLDSYAQGAVMKWPNDIYIGRRKICGILIENSLMGSKLQSSIIGIGININQTEFEGLTATSLALENGSTYDLEELMRQWCSCMQARYDLLMVGRFFDLKTAYLQRLWGLNTVVNYTKEGEPTQGVIKGVNTAGQLVMEENGSEIFYNFKEISFVL